MRPRVSTRWFGVVIAALSGLVLLLAVGTPAASAGPAGSRGCGQRTTCQQEQERLATLLAELLAAEANEARQHGRSGTPAHSQPATVHVSVKVKPAAKPADSPPDSDVVRMLIHATIGGSTQKVIITSTGGTAPVITTSAHPNSTDLLGSLLGGLIGTTTTASNGLVQTTTGLINNLLGITPTPTPPPTPAPTLARAPTPTPASSGGQPPPGQPATAPSASGSSSQHRLQVAPLQGPSLPPSRNLTTPAAQHSSHRAGGVSLNPVSILSSPSTAILVAVIAAFAVAVFGMVYSAGHRGAGRNRPRRAR